MSGKPFVSFLQAWDQILRTMKQEVAWSFWSYCFFGLVGVSSSKTSLQTISNDFPLWAPEFARDTEAMITVDDLSPTNCCNHRELAPIYSCYLISDKIWSAFLCCLCATSLNACAAFSQQFPEFGPLVKNFSVGTRKSTGVESPVSRVTCRKCTSSWLENRLCSVSDFLIPNRALRGNLASVQQGRRFQFPCRLPQQLRLGACSEHKSSQSIWASFQRTWVWRKTRTILSDRGQRSCCKHVTC